MEQCPSTPLGPKPKNYNARPFRSRYGRRVTLEAADAARGFEQNLPPPLGAVARRLDFGKSPNEIFSPRPVRAVPLQRLESSDDSSLPVGPA